MRAGRPSKILQTLARAKNTALPVKVEVVDPKIVALAARFRELQQQAFRDLVGAAVEMGGILLEGKRLTGEGFPAFLDDLAVSRTCAANYMGMAALARRYPQVIERWKELGPSKLYKVARLPESAHREVLQPKNRDELLAMNDREFAALVGPHLPRTATAPTPARKANGLKQKAVSWRRQLGDFHKYFTKHAPDQRPKELETELRALKKAVDELLGAW